MYETLQTATAAYKISEQAWIAVLVVVVHQEDLTRTEVAESMLVRKRLDGQTDGYSEYSRKSHDIIAYRCIPLHTVRYVIRFPHVCTRSRIVASQWCVLLETSLARSDDKIMYCACAGKSVVLLAAHGHR
jgi:hypothetical protein